MGASYLLKYRLIIHAKCTLNAGASKLVISQTPAKVNSYNKRARLSKIAISRWVKLRHFFSEFVTYQGTLGLIRPMPGKIYRIIRFAQNDKRKRQPGWSTLYTLIAETRRHPRQPLYPRLQLPRARVNQDPGSGWCC